MATIKSYSDLQQSRKLAGILPLKSADMHYKVNRFNNESKIFMIPYSELGKYKDDEYQYCVCAWSLASLFSVLPSEIDTHKQTDGYKTYYYVELYMKRMGKEIYLSTERHENLVDACVDMIERLHELKML